MDRSSLDLPRVSSPEVTKAWHHLKLLPGLCHWFVIYMSGLPSTPFTTEAGIRLQRTRETTASLVDQTGTTTTENGICADALETHATGGHNRTSEAHRVPAQISMVSCQKSPARHAYAWQIGHIWQDTLDIRTSVLPMLSRTPFSFHVGLPEDQLFL